MRVLHPVCVTNRLAVNMWVQSPGSVGHVDSGPLTAQLFTKTGHRRTTSAWGFCGAVSVCALSIGHQYEMPRCVCAIGL